MAACGGDDGFSNADKKLSELDDDGLAQLCTDVTDLADSEELRDASARLACFVFIQRGGDACVDADLNECVEEFLALPGGELECNVDLQAATSCEATVGDVEQCANDSFSAIEGLAGATCAELANADDILGDEPDSCVALQAECPGLLVDQSESAIR